MFNRYKLNQDRLNFLPSVVSLVFFGFFLASIFWYFTPFQASEVKVLAVNDIIKTEKVSGKFFGYLNYFEGYDNEPNASISKPNPEITMKSFDSRLVLDQTFYLSQNCQNLSLNDCQIWDLDRNETVPKKMLDSLGNLNITSFEKLSQSENIAKFAEKQDEKWLNIIFKKESRNTQKSQNENGEIASESIQANPNNLLSEKYIGLLQIEKANPKNINFEILARDNPKYAVYFR